MACRLAPLELGGGQRTADHGGIPTPNERKYWFPAKRYGWGWGIPRSWQGWLVLAAFVGLLVVGSFLFPPGAKLGTYLAYVTVLCVLLVGTCWLKGAMAASRVAAWACG